jgi:hypothetical protein
MGKVLSLDPVNKAVGGAFGGGDEGVISAVFDPGNLRDKITGKSEKEAGKAKEKAARDAAELIRQQTEKAREDIFQLFPMSQQNLQQGYQGALDVFGQALPAQTQTFQGGNVAAQQALLSGLPQMQNAILGNPVDYSQFQPVQLQQPDLSFFNQTLPQPQSFDALKSLQDQLAINSPVQQMPGKDIQAGNDRFLGNNFDNSNIFGNILSQLR